MSTLSDLNLSQEEMFSIWWERAEVFFPNISFPGAIGLLTIKERTRRMEYFINLNRPKPIKVRKCKSGTTVRKLKSTAKEKAIKRYKKLLASIKALEAENG